MIYIYIHTYRIWYIAAYCNTCATLCNSLQRTATHTATHCNTLQSTAMHNNTLQHTTTHCNTQQHTATHCNTLQHTAARCNTLQHTATYCNTSQNQSAFSAICIWESNLENQEHNFLTRHFVNSSGRVYFRYGWEWTYIWMVFGCGSSTIYDVFRTVFVMQILDPYSKYGHWRVYCRACLKSIWKYRGGVLTSTYFSTNFRILVNSYIITKFPHIIEMIMNSAHIMKIVMNSPNVTKFLMKLGYRRICKTMHPRCCRSCS